VPEGPGRPTATESCGATTAAAEALAIGSTYGTVRGTTGIDTAAGSREPTAGAAGVDTVVEGRGEATAAAGVDTVEGVISEYGATDEVGVIEI